MRALIFLAVVFFSGPVRAGHPQELIIGHVRLHLGMRQEKALPALSREFDTRLVNLAEGTYLLWTRDKPEGVPRAAGKVSFKAGTLYRASKFWGDSFFGHKATADGLFAVFAEIAGRESQICRVKAETLRAPGTAEATGSLVKLLTIEVPPNRMVRLQITEPLMSPGGVPFQPTTGVEEILTDLNAPK
jgi:hypothetical protein